MAQTQGEDCDIALNESIPLIVENGVMHIHRSKYGECIYGNNEARGLRGQTERAQQMVEEK